MVMSLALGPKSFGFYVRTQVEWVLSQDPPRPTGLLTYTLGPDMEPFLLGQASGPKSLGFRHGPNPLRSRHRPSPQPLRSRRKPQTQPSWIRKRKDPNPSPHGFGHGPTGNGSCIRTKYSWILP
jgi:hypothetical protein